MRVKIWVKTFIPDTILSAKDEEITWTPAFLTASGRKNVSLLPSVTLFPRFFSSYTTDKRDFSSDLHASARITTLIEIPDHEQSEVNIKRYADPTSKTCNPLMNLMFPTQTYSERKTSLPQGDQEIIKRDKGWHISFSSSNHNPFFETAWFRYAPNATLSLDLDLNFTPSGEVEVELKGEISQFPAFEAYIQVEDYSPQTLFQCRPAKGNTHLSLFFGSTPISIKTTVLSEFSEVNELRHATHLN